MFTLTELQANVTKAERPPISPDQFVDGTQNCWHMATRSGLFWATIQEAVGASTMFLWIWFLMWTGISFVGGNFLKGKIVFWKGNVLLKSIKLWQKTVFFGGVGWGQRVLPHSCLLTRKKKRNVLHNHATTFSIVVTSNVLNILFN